MTRPRLRWLLVVAGVLLWLLAVLPAYYVVHRPLAFEPAAAPATSSVSLSAVGITLLARLADLLLLALTLLVASSWGSRIGRWLRVPWESSLERWGLGATLGLGLLGTVVFGLAAVGGLVRGIAYAILALLGVAAWRDARVLLGDILRGLRRVRRTRVPWPWLYAGAIGLLSLGASLLPPTGWDAQVYHLQGPRLYLEARRLVGVPEIFYLNYPAQVEMLFVWGLLLKGDILAKLFHWIFWPLTGLMVYGLARRTMNPRAGQWAVALWASVPLATTLASIAYVDVALTAFVLASAYAFFLWMERRNEAYLTLSAVFAGLAMASKYTAVTWVGLLALLLVYHARRHGRRGFPWLLTRSTVFVATAALVLAPWLVKNWLVTGNPVYPFLFGGAHWNAARQTWLTWPGQPYSRNLLDYLALPWLLTVMGVGGTALFDGTIGPLSLCLVPLAFLARGRPRVVNYGLALVGAQLVYFAVTIYVYLFLAQMRLILAIFPLLCVAAAFALQRLPDWDRPSFRLSRVLVGVVALVLAANLVSETLAFLEIRPLAALVGLESREDYLTRQLGGYYATMRDVDEKLPEDARLLFLWEPRSYYCQRAARPDATLDNLTQLRVGFSDAAAAVAELRNQGFTHLLFHRLGYEYLSEPTARAPTLGTLLEEPSSGPSLYPLTEADARFQEEFLSHWQKVGGLLDIYEIYQLP